MAAETVLMVAVFVLIVASLIGLVLYAASFLQQLEPIAQSIGSSAATAARTLLALEKQTSSDLTRFSSLAQSTLRATGQKVGPALQNLSTLATSSLNAAAQDFLDTVARTILSIETRIDSVTLMISGLVFVLELDVTAIAAQVGARLFGLQSQLKVLEFQLLAQAVTSAFSFRSSVVNFALTFLGEAATAVFDFVENELVPLSESVIDFSEHTLSTIISDGKAAIQEIQSVVDQYLSSSAFSFISSAATSAGHKACCACQSAGVNVPGFSQSFGSLGSVDIPGYRISLESVHLCDPICTPFPCS